MIILENTRLTAKLCPVEIIMLAFLSAG